MKAVASPVGFTFEKPWIAPFMLALVWCVETWMCQFLFDLQKRQMRLGAAHLHETLSTSFHETVDAEGDRSRQYMSGKNKTSGPSRVQCRGSSK